MNGEAGTFETAENAQPPVAAIGVLIRDGSSGGTARGVATCSAGPRFLGTAEACGGSGAAASHKVHILRATYNGDLYLSKTDVTN